LKRFPVVERRDRSKKLRCFVNLMNAHILLLFIGLVFVTPRAHIHAAEKIVLGVATSMTSLEGEESYKAVQLAVNEINATGGVKVGDGRMPIRLVSIDLCDAFSAVPVSESLQRLENFIRRERVNAIVVGPFRSEVLLPSMDIIAHHKVPMLGTIAMSAASEVKIMKDPKYRYIFRVCLDSKYLVSYLINTMKFLNERFGFNRVFIINQDVAWARATASLMIKLFFERAGWVILGLEDYPIGATDFREGLMKAHTKGAQVILPIFDMPQSGILVKQWNLMRVPALLCGFISPMVGPSAWKKFDGNIAGALNVVFELGNVPSTKYTPASDFYHAYRKTHGKEIEAGHGPAPAYDSVYLIAEAIRKARSLDPDKIISALEDANRVGVMGRIIFHKGHQVIFGQDPEKEAVACVIQWAEGGRRRIVYPTSIAEGEIELPTFFKQTD
jgi:branched-chain amino acid transport system substrate-binding protein